jgi:hypothetical protein
MVTKVSKQVRQRAITADQMLWSLNHEVVPLLNELRARVNDMIDQLSPVVAPALLTDSTGGVADGVVSDVGAAFSQATLNGNFAELTGKVNAVIGKLVTLGLLE